MDSTTYQLLSLCLQVFTAVALVLVVCVLLWQSKRTHREKCVLKAALVRDAMKVCGK